MGEKESCREFLEKHRRMIRGGTRKALWLMGCTDPESHSEDVSSEVARRVVRHWDGFEAPERVIHTIIYNAVLDHIEQCLAQVAQEIPDSATPCFVQAGQDPVEVLFEGLLIKELMRRLNQTESSIIQMWFYGHSFEEIGEFLKMPSGSVRSIKSRAVGKMRKVAAG